MSQNTQGPNAEPPSMLLAFIHDEPTLPERLAVARTTKEDHYEKLEKMEKDIVKLLDIVTPNVQTQPQVRN